MLDKPYQYITNPFDVYAIYEECWLYEAIAVDTETTIRRDLDKNIPFNPEVHKPGLDPYLSEIRLLQIATPERVYIIDCWQCPNVVIFGGIFESDKILKIFQNAVFDMKMMMRQWGFDFTRIYCTMLASQILSNGIQEHKRKHSLEEIVQRYLKIEMDKTEQKSDWSRPELTPKQIYYAGRDVDVLHDLCRAQLRYMVDKQRGINLLRIAKIEFDACIATARIELDGVYVDVRLWQQFNDELLVKYKEISEELRKLLKTPDINLESPIQVKKALNDLGILVQNTNEKTLEPLANKHPEIAVLLDYRGIAKMLSSYGNGIPGKKRKKNQVFFLERVHPITKRIHPQFNQCLVETGRYSCDKPNVQQIPSLEKALFRKAFMGQTVNGVRNVFIVSDYSQFEMRILAELSGDPKLIEAFRLGGCIHTATAALMFNVPMDSIQYKDPNTGEKKKGPNGWMRQASKSINFGLVYGRGARSLAPQIGVSEKEAKDLIAKYFKTYPGIQAWLQRAAYSAVSRGMSITPLGRVRYFQFDVNDRFERSSVEREGKNTPIQGCNAEVLKIALYRIHKALKPYGDQVKIVNVIHDEVNAEAPPHLVEEVTEIIKNEMETAGRQVLKTVPVIAEAAYGADWSIK